MKKTSLTRALFVAGVVAMAGAAQADAIFYPDGNVVELGDANVTVSQSGAIMTTPSSDSSMTASSDSSVDTSVLGAGASSMGSTSVTTTTVSTPHLVYVQPNINWDRTTAMSQLGANPHLRGGHAIVDNTTRTQAAATFNVPARAGEASTMTGGAPNVLTTNDRVVVGSYVIPSTVVTGSPYYVFSW